MKSLLSILVSSLLLTSCGVRLSPSYYEKSLREENYVENNGRDYLLYYNKAIPSRISLGGSSDTLKKDQQKNTIALKDQKHRPDFYMITKNDTVQVSNRLIDFAHVINFRDIGGLKTADGGSVKWGKIFRSDQLSALETREFEKFNDLQIQNVYDLRTVSEIRGKEDHLPGSVTYMHVPTVKDNGDLLTQLRKKVMNGEISDEKSVALTLELYRESVRENLPVLKDLILKILHSDRPVLYHCSAGKDRTGIVTALILSVLQVDRQTIMDEYLLSNYYRSAKIEKMLGRAKLAKIVKPRLNLTAIENFMKVDKQYLNATFNVIDQQYGSMDDFIRNELGIDAASRKLIIARFTNKNAGSFSKMLPL